jgi:anti-anti-sigma factor
MPKQALTSKAPSASARIHADVTNGRIVIHVEGRFDFNCHHEFRRTYESAGAFTEYVVDLMGTEYVDSSALGMLLVLREHAAGAPVQIINSRPAVRRILHIANFHTLFRVT